MKSKPHFVLATLLLTAMIMPAFARKNSHIDDQNTASSSESETAKRLDQAAKVLDDIMTVPDKGIPEGIMASAKCVAVVPSLIKGGFIVGGRYGKGVATCRSKS